MLTSKFIPVIEHLQRTPLALKKACSEMMKRLQSQGKTESEGLGNKVTNHEAAFATVLEEFGFVWIPKNKKDDHLKVLPKDGYYYIYQVNGSQASIDFKIMYIKDSVICESYKIDCKHSTSEKLKLNDGWFEADVLYVITWTSKKTVQFFIGYGSLFTTEEENEFRRMIRLKQKELNSGVKKIGNLKVVWRCANEYSLKGFKATVAQTLVSLQLPSSLALAEESV
jgi:hypothetical protein